MIVMTDRLEAQAGLGGYYGFLSTLTPLSFSKEGFGRFKGNGLLCIKGKTSA